MGAVRASLLALFAACSYNPPSGETPTDGVAGDAPATDAPPTARCFGTGFEQVCLANPPTADFSLGGATSSVITDMQANCAELTSESTVLACVIAGRSITIDGSLTASGGLPLVLLATEGELVVEGLVDVSSRRGAERRGAGANPTGGCNGATGAVAGSGGAGGSFGGRGGTGGAGFGGNAPEAAAAIAFPAKLRGGCPGKLGGEPGGATEIGSGGGAVWLFSPAGITISGTINASGSGGSGGKSDLVVNRGGAGGGTGGMIVLEAPTISVDQNGVLVATGAGGGSGNAGLVTGDDGDNPDPGNPDNPAAGGNLGSGFGGNGGVSGDGATGDTNLTQAGSGGGGGTGFIHAFGTVDTSGSVFPPLATN